MKIRKATKKDIPLIAGIEINSGYQFRKNPKLEDCINIVKTDFKTGREYYLYGNQAYCSLIIRRKTCEFEFLSVLKKYHGKGIGTKLISHREKIAKNKGCNKIIVEVNQKNFPIISIYTKRGYYVTKIKEKINYGKKIKKLILEKKLK